MLVMLSGLPGVGKSYFAQELAKAAELANVPFMAIELVCADSQLHRSRLEGRRRGLQQYPEPTWNDVLRRANGAEEWTCPRLVLDTVDDVSVLVEAALAYLATVRKPTSR